MSGNCQNHLGGPRDQVVPGTAAAGAAACLLFPELREEGPKTWKGALCHLASEYWLGIFQAAENIK